MESQAKRTIQFIIKVKGTIFVLNTSFLEKLFKTSKSKLAHEGVSDCICSNYENSPNQVDSVLVWLMKNKNLGTITSHDESYLQKKFLRNVLIRVVVAIKS